MLMLIRSNQLKNDVKDRLMMEYCVYSLNEIDILSYKRAVLLQL